MDLKLDVRQALRGMRRRTVTAILLPVRRAAETDPAAALRSE
jgi:hypothetical protein